MIQIGLAAGMSRANSERVNLDVGFCGLGRCEGIAPGRGPYRVDGDDRNDNDEMPRRAIIHSRGPRNSNFRRNMIRRYRHCFFSPKATGTSSSRPSRKTVTLTLSRQV